MEDSKCMWWGGRLQVCVCVGVRTSGETSISLLAGRACQEGRGGNSHADTLPSICPAEKYNFLGISIVGQSNERGDGGIYIGSIMKGGAVAADGRIEPGDMLLQVLHPGPRCLGFLPAPISDFPACTPLVENPGIRAPSCCPPSISIAPPHR